MWNSNPIIRYHVITIAYTIINLLRYDIFYCKITVPHIHTLVIIDRTFNSLGKEWGEMLTSELGWYT